MSFNKFEFLSNYKYYGRRSSLLKEDELDDALGLNDPQGDQSNQQNQQAQFAPDQTQPDASQPTQGQDQPAPDQAQSAPSEGEPKVELDVTQLVLKQDQMTQTVQDILTKLDSLMKNSEVMKSDINKKIDDLEGKNADAANKMRQEFEKRTPTPVEKLQMQSLYSFPYNIKLTDYWKPTEEDKYKYAVANVKTNLNDDPTFNVNVDKLPDIQKTPDNEYILKQSEIMQGYNENYIKNSF